MNQRTMFPDATPADVRLQDKVLEIQRELDMRRHLYPKWIQSGKISHEDAHKRIIVLEAILEDYMAAMAKTTGGSHAGS